MGRLADSEPLISVLLPVFDAERTLPDALFCVLAQSCTDFELLALDDGSADRGPEMLAELAVRDERIRVFTGPRAGLVARLNEGLAEARAPFIARMDADDLCHPRRFERQLEHLRAHPDCVAVGTGCAEIDPDGRPIRPLELSTDHDAIVARLIAGDGGALVHASALYRADALAAVGGWRAAFEGGEDVDLHLRLAERGRLANLPEVLFSYRKSFDGITFSRRVEVRERQDAAIREALERAGRDPGSAPARPPVAASPEPERIWAIWANRALVAGYASTARHYAWQAFRAAPREHWKLLVRIWLGVEPFFWDRLLGR